MKLPKINLSSKHFTWAAHGLTSAVAAIASSDLIKQFPPKYQPLAYGLIFILAYLLGVAVPTPQ